ncbi:transmembrane protein 179-like isoform X2 [Liolophura sinensis]|uniref:transmembrane protein 179-like isoform X2 n=1 Tax=Liolophura sinensis TaxID=3198878 RepID=UPI00315805FE
MEILLLVQTVLYFAIAILGFFITAPVAATVNNFKGKCVLYGTVQWYDDSKFHFKPGNLTLCEFNIYLHVGIAILYASSVGAIHVFLLFKERKNEQLEIPKIVRLSLIIANGICAFLTLVSAGTLSAGLSEWCSQLMEGKNYHFAIQSCSDGQNFQYSAGIDGSSFHTCFTLALVSAWVELTLWLTQVGLGLLRFLRG